MCIIIVIIRVKMCRLTCLKSVREIVMFCQCNDYQIIFLDSLDWHIWKGYYKVFPNHIDQRESNSISILNFFVPFLIDSSQFVIEMKKRHIKG